MSISFYILLFSNIILFAISQIGLTFLEDNHILLSLILIAVFGIPHGAIDHLLFMKNTKRSALFFYTFYLIFILSVVALWIITPTLSLILFLFVSSYHFGQSQFERYPKLSRAMRARLYFVWGTFVLSAFVLFNLQEIHQMANTFPEFLVFQFIFDFTLFTIATFCSGLLLVYYGFVFRKAISVKKELLYLGLILLTFYFQPLLLGFALFFVFNHAAEVMQSEYVFLAKINRNFTITRFIKTLAPFTILSLIGILLLYILSYFSFISLSLPSILLIVISSLTLPHAIVMEVFYSQNK
jgi:beta-carotene 15,15'-dioxygenase